MRGWELKLDRCSLPGLDALRGIAICGVIVAHFFGNYLPGIVEKCCATGGVMLFFLLSGFLIDRTFHHDENVARYAVRRAMRILPMYFAAVFLIAATDSKWTGPDIAANLIFSATFANQMSGVFWTLYVECLFYVLAPLAILSGRIGIMIAPLLIVARFAYGSAFGVQASPSWFFLSYCFLGLQIGAAWRGALPASVAVMSAAVVATASGVVSLGVWQAPLSVVCVLALCACLRFNPKARPLGFIGKVSYSWYLLHSIFGYTIGWKAVAWLHIPAVVGLAFGALSMLALSAITYWLIETPGIRLGKAMISRYVPAKVVPA